VWRGVAADFGDQYAEWAVDSLLLVAPEEGLLPALPGLPGGEVGEMGLLVFEDLVGFPGRDGKEEFFFASGK
jgi:hypothetical protein